MAKEANNFYEAERKNIVISHADFSHEQEMDYVSETDELYDFLLSKKDWEAQLETSKKFSTISTRIANDIFAACDNLFDGGIDSVKLFDVITCFYNFDPTDYYNRLGHAYRNRLLRDLTERIGKINISDDTAVGDGKVQKTFMSLLSKFKQKK